MERLNDIRANLAKATILLGNPDATTIHLALDCTRFAYALLQELDNKLSRQGSQLESKTADNLETLRDDLNRHL